MNSPGNGPGRLLPGRGVLIVFEGVDGAGKSTQVRLLVEALRAEGLAVRVDREPTDGPHGRRLRESATAGRLSAEAELDLFMADRRDHVRDFIQPGLEAGEVVVLDRYYYSNAAYQGARGLDPETILQRNREFAPAPDLVLWLDLPPGASAGRIRGRGTEINEFERGEHLERCRQIYAAIRDPAIRRVDASGGVDAVAAEVWGWVRRVLNDRGSGRLGSAAGV